MCKFEGENDINYKRVSGQLAAWFKELQKPKEESKVSKNVLIKLRFGFVCSTQRLYYRYLRGNVHIRLASTGAQIMAFKSDKIAVASELVALVVFILEGHRNSNGFQHRVSAIVSNLKIMEERKTNEGRNFDRTI